MTTPPPLPTMLPLQGAKLPRWSLLVPVGPYCHFIMGAMGGGGWGGSKPDLTFKYDFQEGGSDKVTATRVDQSQFSCTLFSWVENYLFILLLRKT